MCRQLGIEYIRVNKIDGIEFVEIHEDGINNYQDNYVLVNIIKIDEIYEEKPVQIYGTVVLSSGCPDQIVYHRTWNNPETKVPGEYLSLTGPFIPVCVEDPFIIYVCLWFHHDDGIIKGNIEDEMQWEMRISPYPPYDQLVQQEMLGKYGSVTLGYCVIRNALNATINVEMINGDRESPVVAAVYGTIKAVCTLHDDGSLMTRILFDKSENEYVQVQQSIPLTRRFFPVRENSSLTIMVDLWDHDSLSPDDQITLPSFSPDDQIALGSVQFNSIVGTRTKNITSKYGELQVSFSCVDI